MVLQQKKSICRVCFKFYCNKLVRVNDIMKIKDFQDAENVKHFRAWQKSEPEH